MKIKLKQIIKWNKSLCKENETVDFQKKGWKDERMKGEEDKRMKGWDDERSRR